MLTSKGIVNILLSVAELRNKWKGHGGIASEEENKQRVTTLEQQLNELRKFIADGFEETRMLSPTTSSYRGRSFYIQCERTCWSKNTIQRDFNQITYST